MDQQLDGFVSKEAQQRRAVFRLFNHRRADTLAEVDHVADPRALRVAQERLPFARALALVQCRADARLPPPALELRGDHLGIVEHQHIAGLK